MSHGVGKRRHKRIPAALPVRLWGMDANGRPFIEVSTTENVSRTGASLKRLPTKLSQGDIVGLRCSEKKYRFRVVWTGKIGTPDEGRVGLQSLEPGKWIWDGLHLPADDADVYTLSTVPEQRQLKRVRCLISAEIVASAAVRATQRILAFATNISVGGCYISTPYPIPAETTVSVALWLDEQHKVWTDGVIVSSHPQIGVGVKFLSVTRRTAEAIEHGWSTFCKTVRAERGNKCEVCGVPEPTKEEKALLTRKERQKRELHLHHVKKLKTHRHLRFERSNVVVCCVECHKELDKTAIA